MTTYVTLDTALAIVKRLQETVGVGAVADVGLLDIALARPGVSAFGVDAYDTLAAKAAALLDALVRLHALVDGNKRTAWVITRVFVELNGFELIMTADSAEALLVDVAEGAYLDVGDLASVLSVFLVPSRS